MIVQREEKILPAAFLHYEAHPTPVGVDLTIRDGQPSEEGVEYRFFLSKTEAWALVGHVAPAAMQAGNGENLD